MPVPLVTRILIADDFSIVREGLKKVLDAKDDLEVVAEAADGAEAVDKALKEDVHVAILDVSMPRMTGIQAAAELQKHKPELRIVILSMYDSEQFLFEALKAGASGYVLKSGADTDIVDAVRAAVRGDSFLYPSAVATLVRDYVEHGGRGEAQFDVLTPRELEVLKLLARGMSNAEVAAELVVSETTVKTHVARVLMKLGVRDRVQAVVLAYESGVVAPGATSSE
jgi:DNA-binding NarL/FixJ family response regulator